MIDFKRSKLNSIYNIIPLLKKRKCKKISFEEVSVEKCLSFIFVLIDFGLVLWHINHCRLFHAKLYLYIYIKYI